MRTTRTDKLIIFPSLIWLGVLAAALIGAYFRGLDLSTIWPLALLATAPALISLALVPILREEWAQIIVIFAWAGIAVLACTAMGFVPMALMFLCVPAIAMLFVKEKVVEALVISALIAGLLFFASRMGYVPSAPISDTQVFWGRQTGLMGTIAVVIAAMYSAAQKRMTGHIAPKPTEAQAWREGVNGGLLEFDEDGKLSFSNEIGTQHFGLDGKTETISHKTLMDFNPDAQSRFEHIYGVMHQTRQPQSLRLALRDTGEDLLTHLDMFMTPLKSGGAFLHTMDRTEDETKLETLRRSQSSAQRDSTDKTLFFAGVSHELRTPLNAIIGFSDMMRSRLFGPLPGKYAEYADLIHDSGQHMLDLIGDVLDMSKVEAGKYELTYDNFDAVDVLRSSVKMIRPAADAAELSIEINVPENDPLIVQADRRAVRQILLNLLSNAVKFSGKGSVVHVSSFERADHLILSVRDEGSGMSAEEVGRIGEPYVQGQQSKLTSERGSGLGLSLVQSLAELHGGNMDINSIVGAGTDVVVRLPLLAPA